jgi:DNA (cytosine-5)-methyltransferase 1
MRILNLYAGIGGNRRYWGNEHEITALEYDPKIAAIYADLYPNDTVIVGDAHAYLLEHFEEFDFIWSSPPCQTHSSFRHNIGVRYRGVKPAYPDGKLFEEIIFLQHHFNGKYVIENVVPYYAAMFEPQKINRHLYWANFTIGQLPKIIENLREAQIPQLQELHGVNLANYSLPNKRQVLRNCVHGETGLAILEKAIESMTNDNLA